MFANTHARFSTASRCFSRDIRARFCAASNAPPAGRGRYPADPTSVRHASQTRCKFVFDRLCKPWVNNWSRTQTSPLPPQQRACILIGAVPGLAFRWILSDHRFELAEQAAAVKPRGLRGWRSHACAGSVQAGAPDWRHPLEDAQVAPPENRSLQASC